MKTKKKTRFSLREIVLKIPQVLWEKHLQEVPQRQYTPELTTIRKTRERQDRVEYRNDIC